MSWSYATVNRYIYLVKKSIKNKNAVIEIYVALFKTEASFLCLG